MAIYPFFARAMGIYTLDRKFTQEELDFVAYQEKMQNIGNETSLNRDILRAPELSSLYDFVTASVNEYIFSVYDPAHKITPYITQSWASYTSKNQHHHKHSHGNSWISGVLYLNVLEREDHIIFARNEYSLVQVHSKSTNEFNSEYYPVWLKNGLLVLFPSYTEHFVPNVAHDMIRTSIAFNVWVKGTLGNSENLNELILP